MNPAGAATALMPSAAVIPEEMLGFSRSVIAAPALVLLSLCSRRDCVKGLLLHERLSDFETAGCALLVAAMAALWRAESASCLPVSAAHDS